ncbi:MAG: serine protease [Candidatus Micrarchaeota archaeon]
MSAFIMAPMKQEADKKTLERLKRGIAAVAAGSLLVFGSGIVGTSHNYPGMNAGMGERGFWGREILEDGPLLPGSRPAQVEEDTSPPSGLCSADAQVESLARTLRDSSVMIRSEGGLGSGTIIARRDGETFILTNRHVVESEAAGPNGTVYLAGGMEVHNGGSVVRPVRVHIAPEDLDLAIVVVREDIGPPVRFAHSLPRRGAGVVVIGSPLGFEDSITRGIVSNFAVRTTDSGMRFHAIQTDAAINPGNSGGGIFLISTGEMVGVTAFKLGLNHFSTAEGMGFGIPVRMIERYPADGWAQIRTAPPAPDAGMAPGGE